MKLEHIGYNVAEPQKLMDWWCAHLGFKQVHPAFIVDSTGQMSLEFYRNDAAPIPDYAAMDPLSMHIAFLSQDVDADAARLVAAGAVLLETVHKPGFDMTMLRDPFGMAIQFVKRGTPILG
jgi:catechol 2,3-dioxygenase-like lactoylglutathione lyase family enzyme